MPRLLQDAPGQAFERSTLGRRAWLRWALTASALAGPLGLVCRVARASPRIGQPAPPLVLHALDGTSISSKDLLGSVVIATFWATWCEPCKEELPLLSAYAASHAQAGLRVLGFSLNGPEDLAAVRSVAATLSFPVGLLGSDRVAGYGRIWKLPVSFTIDRAGRLVDNTWDDEQPAWTTASLERVITPLLAQDVLGRSSSTGT